MQVEEQTLYGHWWIAGSDAKKVEGILEIESSGRTIITLFLNNEIRPGDFFPSEDAVIGGKAFNFPRLAGLLHNGKTVTAETVSCCLMEMNTAISKYHCYPTYICVSQIDFGTDDLLLSNISLEIDGLDTFISVYGFQYTFNLETEKHNKTNPAIPKVNYSLPPSIELFKEDGISLHAHFGCKFSPSPSQIIIKQTTMFRFDSETPMTLSDWWDNIISISYFLCLLFGQPLPLQSIKASYNLHDRDHVLDFFVYSEPNPRRVTKPMAGNLLFHQTEVRDSVGKLIKEFIKLRNKYYLIFDSFFASKFTDEQYISMRFFMIVKALEGFHRQLIGNNNRTYKNLSLEKRFKELFDGLDQSLGRNHQWGDTAKKTTIYRNQEVHLMNTAQNYNSRDMLNITQTLHAVFAMLFLAEAARQSNFEIKSYSFIPNNWIFLSLPPHEPKSDSD